MKTIVALISILLVTFYKGDALCSPLSISTSSISDIVPSGGHSGYDFSELVIWLENSGQVPQIVSLAAIKKASDWGQQTFGLSYGQMVSKYAQGQLTVSYVSVAPPSLVFRVNYGGFGITVILDSV